MFSGHCNDIHKVGEIATVVKSLDVYVKVKFSDGFTRWAFTQKFRPLSLKEHIREVNRVHSG